MLDQMTSLSHILFKIGDEPSQRDLVPSPSKEADSSREISLV